MSAREVAIYKTRPMLALNLADLVGGHQWEVAHFRRLSRETLLKLCVLAGGAVEAERINRQGYEGP